MGFTLTRNCSFSSVRSLRTPEEELAAKTNHNHMIALSINPPIVIGSERQILWAKKIASQFLFHAHAWKFSAEQINLVFANNGKYARFWIENRNPSGNSGEGRTREAVEKLLEEMNADRAAFTKSQEAIAELTPQQLAAKVRRL